MRIRWFQTEKTKNNLVFAFHIIHSTAHTTSALSEKKTKKHNVRICVIHVGNGIATHMTTIPVLNNKTIHL